MRHNEIQGSPGSIIIFKAIQNYLGSRHSDLEKRGATIFSIDILRNNFMEISPENNRQEPRKLFSCLMECV